MSNSVFLYKNRFDDATPVASSTDSDTKFNVLNLRDWRPYTWWKPATMPATVTVNAGSAKAVDYWYIPTHDLGTQNATAELRRSNDNFAANDVLVDTVTPADDKPILRLVTSVSEQYWRIKVTGATAPQLAIVAMGAVLTMPVGLSTGFDPIGRKPMGQVNFSIKGNPLGRSIDYEEWRADLRFELVTWAFLRDAFKNAWTSHLRSKPYGFAWDPTNYPGEVFLVNSAGDFKAPHRPGSYADLTIPITGVYP